MRKSLIKRLAYDGEADFLRLMGLFQDRTAPVFAGDMKNHFKIAKQKPYRFSNHSPVLAISLGGTNLKIMIASMKEGTMVVEHARTMKNPAKPTDFYQFFDDLLLKDEQVHNYIKNKEKTYVGFSFPMAVINGVPYHATKVPTLSGVILRDINKLSQDWDFDRNFKKYLENRGLPPVKLFYQGDGIIAHHGAVSLCDVRKDDSTTLVICGTGLATGDEENYIQMGIAPLLDHDEQIYPASATENYQYHYGAAGKGLFGLMDRCIKIKSTEQDSLLDKYNLNAYFRDAEGSKTVIQIWESSLPGQEPEGEAYNIFNMVGEKAYCELQQIAGRIVERVIGCVTNSIVATIIKMGPAENMGGHKVFFEGSIAVNRSILPRVKDEVIRRVRNKDLYSKLAVCQPYEPDMEKTLKPLVGINNSVKAQLRNIDITLIGAATSIIAESNLRE